MDQRGGSGIRKAPTILQSIDAVAKRVAKPTAELNAITSRDVAVATYIGQPKANTIVGTIRKPTQTASK